MQNADLAKAVNDKARKIKVRGPDAIVPLKFDTAGDVVTESTPPDRIILKRLSLRDLEFLQKWRNSNWDVEKTIQDAKINFEDAERLVKKLQCFREEDAKVKALSEIPTQAWIAAKHVENVYEGGRLAESEHKSLSELAKISGAYKNANQTSVSITQNVFNFPKISPETEAQLKAIAARELSQEADVA